MPKNILSVVTVFRETAPDFAIRFLEQDEVCLLKNFLYEAIFIPEGMEPPPRSIISQPELHLYIDNFGTQKGDHCNKFVTNSSFR